MKAKAGALLVLLALLVSTSGCATWKKWFGKKEVEKPPEVMAQEGIEQLKKKKYIDAADTFAKIKDRFPYSEQALLAQIKLADAKYYDERYDDALQAYKEFEKLHPTNKAAPYVIFQQGMCYYRQRSTIDRDQTFTQKALDEFQRLKKKFPQSEYAGKADKYISRCRMALAEHNFYVANFYFRTKRYAAALDRYQSVAQEYPEFRQAEVKKQIAACETILAAPEDQNKGFLSNITGIFDARW